MNTASRLNLLIAASLLTLAACQSSEDPDQSAAAQAPPTTQVPEPPGQPHRGQDIYESHCARCHSPDASNAPALGETVAWEDRSNLWMGVLSEHVKQGYFEMPARAGDTALSNADVEAATEYLLLQAFPDRPAD